MTIYKIYIHTTRHDVFVGQTPIREQQERAVKNLIKDNKDVKIVTILPNGTTFTSVKFWR